MDDTLATILAFALGLAILVGYALWAWGTARARTRDHDRPPESSASDLADGARASVITEPKPRPPIKTS